MRHEYVQLAQLAHCGRVALERSLCQRMHDALLRVAFSQFSLELALPGALATGLLRTEPTELLAGLALSCGKSWLPPDLPANAVGRFLLAVAQIETS